MNQLTLLTDLDLFAAHAQNHTAWQTDDGVAPPLLTALDRLEQERIGPFRQFAVGADGCFQIGQHFGTDRYTVVVLCRQRGKVLRIHGLYSERVCAYSGRGKALATIASK